MKKEPKKVYVFQKKTKKEKKTCLFLSGRSKFIYLFCLECCSYKEEEKTVSNNSANINPVFSIIIIIISSFTLSLFLLMGSHEWRSTSYL